MINFNEPPFIGKELEYINEAFKNFKPKFEKTLKIFSVLDKLGFATVCSVMILAGFESNVSCRRRLYTLSERGYIKIVKYAGRNIYTLTHKGLITAFSYIFHLIQHF